MTFLRASVLSVYFNLPRNGYSYFLVSTTDKYNLLEMHAFKKVFCMFLVVLELFNRLVSHGFSAFFSSFSSGRAVEKRLKTEASCVVNIFARKELV